MDYLPRLIESKIRKALPYYPVLCLLGARQVGKSTLIEQNFRTKYKSVTFDPVRDIGNARKDPDFFLQNNPGPLFLDEIQYAPELLPALKRRVDKEKINGKYIISGSQNLMLLKSLSESLAGRVSIQHLYSMSFKELNSDVKGTSFLREWVENSDWVDSGLVKEMPPASLHQTIWRGGYPKLIQFPDRQVPGYWDSYLQTYVERDIRSAIQIGSLQKFGNFFGLLSALTAQEINHSQLGRELDLDRKTVESWTAVAQATYQWVQIPSFSRNPIKRISGKPKGYFTDTGFGCFLQSISSSFALQNHPMQGRFVETFVVMEILKLISAWEIKPSLYHFRTYAGAEVDLIIELDGKLFPVEIKAKTNPVPKDERGFKALRECFPNENFAPNLLVCSCEKPEWLTKETLAVPWWVL